MAYTDLEENFLYVISTCNELHPEQYLLQFRDPWRNASADEVLTLLKSEYDRQRGIYQTATNQQTALSKSITLIDLLRTHRYLK